MSNFCIVSEFNPFHNGHAYLIKKAREMGADTVTCIMSGNATQRGELAITDKYLRAQAAVECGADLVIELPFPWCSASAEYFAEAATCLVAPFGDKLIFGSECADVEKLQSAARFCESEEFSKEYDKLLRDGAGAASAFTAVMRLKGYDSLSSNDILGISYIRSIIRNNLSLEPVTVSRIGAAYNEKNEVCGDIQSATAIRALLNSCELERLEKYIPKSMCDKLEAEYKAGRLTDLNEIDALILGFFRLCEAESLSDIADTSGGIINRLVSVAKQSTTAAEMLDAVRTKRYTDAKLRRAILYSLTGTPASVLKEKPEYSLLLAANDKGRELLAKNRKGANSCVITKPADAPKDSMQYVLSEKLDAVYALARKNKYPSDFFLKKGAYIQK
ncbi:MAG: nucleotidyltransferase family protein [Ruminococcaceae bacterium]|nr:nucleotidyltransferase family protein [Oscillospiraceae bacterium]